VDHADHVGLIRAAVEPSGTWADVGAGEGAFTLALADLLGPGGRIVAIDRDARALRSNESVVRSRFPAVDYTAVTADLTGPLDLPELDGLVAANSLHYVPRDRQVAVIAKLAGHLRPGGRFVVVEYDSDRRNTWVPHPFSATSWERLAVAAGLTDTRRIGRVPSRFLGAIYAAESRRPEAPGSLGEARDQ
jgi:SAM-dependent methyltransferase